MQNDNLSRLEKWRSKYGALAIAVSCLISLLNRWGSHWLLTIILGLGVLICGWIGIGDLKRAKKIDNAVNTFEALTQGSCAFFVGGKLEL